jgi:hypothetical protein
VHLLTLWAPLETVILRDRARVDRAPLGERVTACWHAMAINLPELGTVVDARGVVDEVVTDARRQIAAGTGRVGSASPGGHGECIEGQELALGGSPLAGCGR